VLFNFGQITFLRKIGLGFGLKLCIEFGIEYRKGFELEMCKQVGVWLEFVLGRGISIGWGWVSGL